MTADRHRLLAQKALALVGITEHGGDNKGPEVEEFQKAVDGLAAGEPWCLAMVQYAVLQVDSDIDNALNQCSVDRTTLYPTEHVQTLWKNTPKRAKHKNPKPGYIACWAFYNKEGNKTSSGHAGIVIKVLDGHMITVEGNTGPDNSTIVREGDGVYKKMRKTSNYKYMRLLGFIDPWG